jgi:hypothetical protein
MTDEFAGQSIEAAAAAIPASLGGRGQTPAASIPRASPSGAQYSP